LILQARVFASLLAGLMLGGTALFSVEHFCSLEIKMAQGRRTDLRLGCDL
jgi:hypothetical protein